MQNTILQYFFIIGVVFFFVIIIFFLRKKALSLKYTLLWLISCFVMLIISIFPGILTFISKIFGFQVASNALFALILGFFLLILLSLTSIVSGQTEKIKTLTQVIALLEKRIRELEEKQND
jgi:hypothetical protein